MIKKIRSFENIVFLKGIKFNLFAALIIFLYSSYFIGMNGQQMLYSGLFVFVMVALSQAGIAPFTNKIISSSLSKNLAIWENENLNEEERTDLLEKVMKYPKIKGLETLGFFIVCAFLLFGANHFITKIDIFTNAMSLFICLFGAYNAHMLALNFSESICSSYAKKIVEQGVDQKRVKRVKVFNYTLGNLFVLYTVIPIVFTTCIACCIILKGYIPNQLTQQLPTFNEQILRLIAISIVNVVLSVILSFLFFNLIRKNSEQITDTLMKINNSDIQKDHILQTDLSNELSFNIYLMNETINKFRSIIDKANTISNEVLESTHELVVVSNENSATSVEQAAGVREIVSAMEDSEQLSKNISNRVEEVYSTAVKNAEDVRSGIDTLFINSQKMHEITNANLDTINGIKDLSEQIEGIWDVVKIINNIADQTKIIAFNAELEAASAGESGKNFHIVANEIRRLADGTMESTREIKERIAEIQHSSDKLIVTSEEGTNKIHEGCELNARLENNFENIQKTSECTTETTGEIKMIIEQQSAAFDQILITLKQISAGIENFSSATKNVNNSSIKLQTISDKLSEITK